MRSRSATVTVDLKFDKAEDFKHRSLFCNQFPNEAMIENGSYEMNSPRRVSRSYRNGGQGMKMNAIFLAFGVLLSAALCVSSMTFADAEWIDEKGTNVKTTASEMLDILEYGSADKVNMRFFIEF